MTRFATRLAPSLAVLLLGCTAMSAPASAAWSLFGGDSKAAAAPVQDAKSAPAGNLEDSVRQAQMLRLAGNYDDAIHHLSQLMMVASDDGRVVSEYGKTLAAMGRASEAVQFLTRAQQLQPGDWSVYSAMGVSYDQLGNQKDAAVSYERALALKPGEPSVLTNYALSRMLANDPETAKKLIGRAEIAGAASDPKLARNISLIRQMAPDTADHAYAVQKPVPAPVAQAPQARVTQAQAQPAPFVNIPTAPALPVRNASVVMQRVPVDALAGPVATPSASVATHAPRPLAKPQTDSAVKPEVKAIATAKPDAPVKTADAQAQSLEAKAEAIAKTLAAKPQEKVAVMAQAMSAAPKVLPPAPAKAAIVAPKPSAPAPVAVAKVEMKTQTPAKTVAAAPKPAAPIAVVKVASKPEAPVKTATKEAPKKDSVPALRLSANAY